MISINYERRQYYIIFANQILYKDFVLINDKYKLFYLSFMKTDNVALIEQTMDDSTNTNAAEETAAAAPLKKSNSLLEYILNHRQDILEKVENERKIEIQTQSPLPPPPQSEIDDLKKKLQYIQTIRWYIIFVIYGFLGGIVINAASGVQIINFDMIFNVIISPIIYYHSPRNILINIKVAIFLKYYTLFFLLGLGFRFLDRIPGCNEFTLDPTNITTPSQIGICILVIILLCAISGYFIIISSEPVLHLLFFLLEGIMVISTSYFYIIINKGRIHIHHYFIGLVLMLVSKNYHSKIVIITHAISYAIYIEGISKWGIDAIYWKEAS